MKNAIQFFAVAVLVLCTACSKQEPQQKLNSGQAISLTVEAYLGAADQTKTAFSYSSEYGSIESVWSSGDKIYVYSRKTGEQLGILTQIGDIVNQKESATSQFPISYANFSGSITLGVDDDIKDAMAFVYQGAGRNLTVDASGNLSYTMGISATITGLEAWDVAYATGIIQGSASSASCAVTFDNKMAFGYFTTAGLADGKVAEYYKGFTLNVKNGVLSGIVGNVPLPDNQAFFMPLIPGSVSIYAGRIWSKPDTKWGYTQTKLSKPFTAVAGKYYRLSRNDSFGPVPFVDTSWINYETLQGKKFSVSATKEVYFTQGILQYIGSADTPYWRVAIDQYSCLGANNGVPTSELSGSTIPITSDVDLFGWGEVAPPFLGSTVAGEYKTSITENNANLDLDWSTKFNVGSPKEVLYADPGKEYPKYGEGDYCCLTKDEWLYLFSNHFWGLATVTMNDGTTRKGYVIYPNNVTDKPSGTWHKGTSVPSTSWTSNIITQGTIDSNGLLFMNVSGTRNGTAIYISEGRYWTTTSFDPGKAYRITIDTWSGIGSSFDRCRASAVRVAIVAPAPPTP